jgi:hypothetical protein
LSEPAFLPRKDHCGRDPISDVLQFGRWRFVRARQDFRYP